jgi:uncharacterized MAPEG superfamily protein
MTIPVWMLLGFAIWTVLLLFGSVGFYRWSRILTKQVQIKQFRADQIEGPDWYRRAMRAHANCIENLPIFGVIVFSLYVSDLTSSTIDKLTIVVLIARIFQSTLHVAFEQTNTKVLFRFVFYFIQIICFLWLAAILIVQVGISK